MQVQFLLGDSSWSGLRSLQLVEVRPYAEEEVSPTSRRCTLNRTYRERSSAVWCGTVQCTFFCSLLRRISPYTLLYYDKRGNYTLSKNTKGWYTAYTRVRPIYPQYTPGTNQKFGGPVPPWPQPKTATASRI